MAGLAAGHARSTQRLLGAEVHEFLERSARSKALMLVAWNQTTQRVCMTLVTRATPQQQRGAPA